MTSSKIYYLKDISGNIWCYGYYNGKSWRVFNNSDGDGVWFNWTSNPLATGLFAYGDYILANNFKEKPDVSN